MADRAKLRAMLAEATPGPWEARPARRYPTGLHAPWGAHLAQFYDGDDTRGRIGKLLPMGANAEICAAARNELPGLLDELDRAERERDEAREILAAIDKNWDGYANGEFGPDDPEGVEALARAHALVAGKPTCKWCGHEEADHERPPEDPNSMPCERCSCDDFRSALSPPSPETAPAREALESPLPPEETDRAEGMARALEAWEHWYAEDSTEFNREMARDAGLKALAAYRSSRPVKGR